MTRKFSPSANRVPERASEERRALVDTSKWAEHGVEFWSVPLDAQSALLMPPGTPHCVFTLKNTIIGGKHLLLMEWLPMTLHSQLYESIYGAITNTQHSYYLVCIDWFVQEAYRKIKQLAEDKLNSYLASNRLFLEAAAELSVFAHFLIQEGIESHDEASLHHEYLHYMRSDVHATTYEQIVEMVAFHNLNIAKSFKELMLKHDIGCNVWNDEVYGPYGNRSDFLDFKIRQKIQVLFGRKVRETGIDFVDAMAQNVKRGSRLPGIWVHAGVKPSAK